MAIQRQRIGRGFIHHSGRGSQYAAGDYRELLKANGIVPSMSRKGNCWDNAPMESWFRILKTELVHHTGGRKVIIAPGGGDAWAPAKPRPDETLIRALARGHRWKRRS
jgi:transposase InsO family protein